MQVENVRTMLFTPANRPERFLKAQTTGADGIIIDLEDAISLENKDEARKIAVDYFKSAKKEENFLQALRINSIKTPAGLKDISALLDNQIRPDLIVLPKTEFAAELAMLDLLLQPLEVPYLALIETSVGLHNVVDIAHASSNVAGLVFGGADFAADLGATLTWEPMLYARSQIVAAAATAGIAVLDVPYLNLHDADDTYIIAETQRVKAMGFTGKLAIHPKHIKPILDTFTPSTEEVDRAKRVVAAYEGAKGNASQIDGKMIDVPVYRSAKRILSLVK